MKKMNVLIIITLSLLFFSCDEEDPKGCCYSQSSLGSWICTDDSFQFSCDKVEGSQFLENGDCNIIQYCNQSSCEAMTGCSWVAGTYVDDYCVCN